MGWAEPRGGPADARVPGWLLRWGRWQAEALGWNAMALENAGVHSPA